MHKAVHSPISRSFGLTLLKRDQTSRRTHTRARTPAAAAAAAAAIGSARLLPHRPNSPPPGRAATAAAALAHAYAAPALDSHLEAGGGGELDGRRGSRACEHKREEERARAVSSMRSSTGTSGNSRRQQQHGQGKQQREQRTRRTRHPTCDAAASPQAA